MNSAPAGACAPTEHAADCPIATEPGSGDGPGVGAAVMAGDDLDVLVPRSAVPVLVLDASIGEVNVAVVIRQLVFASPPRDLVRFPIWAPIAVLLASVSLVQEALVVAFELVVQGDAIHAAALLTKALRGPYVGPVNVRVVG